MNRHEVEERLRTVEAKVRFLMHTLALTRKDNSTGETDSRTLDTLFAEALKHEALQHTMDGAQLAQMAEKSFDNSPPPVGRTVPTTPGPDGDSRSPDGDPGDGESDQPLPFAE